MAEFDAIKRYAAEAAAGNMSNLPKDADGYTAPSPLAAGAPTPRVDLNGNRVTPEAGKDIYGNSTAQTQKNQAALTQLTAPTPQAGDSAFANTVGAGIDVVKGALKYGAGAAAVPIGNVKDAYKNAAAGLLGAERPNPNADTEVGLELMRSGTNDFSSASNAFNAAKPALAKAAGWTPTPAATSMPAQQPTPVATSMPAQQPTPVATSMPAQQPTPVATSMPPVASIDRKPGRQEPGAMLAGNAPLDAYGNNMTATLAAQAQLRANDTQNAAVDTAAAAAATPIPGTDYQSRRDAESDRFTRFVNESDAARMAHDLAIGSGGGGSASGRQGGGGDAGKIAALASLQRSNEAAREAEGRRVAGIQAATQARANNATQAQGQLLNYDQATKGQKLGHDTAMAQILGSPLQQQGQLLDNAIKSGALDQAKMMADLQAKAADAAAKGDTAKQAMYARLLMQLQGKEPASRFTAMHMQGGVDPNTMAKLPDQGFVIDQSTGIAKPIQGAPAAKNYVVGQKYPGKAPGTFAIYQADGTWKEVK